MSRTRVMAFVLRTALVYCLKQQVPDEGRSAFVVRAVTREVGMSKSKQFTETEPTAADIEAYTRGWLTCLLYGPAQDPRVEFDSDDATEFMEETIRASCVWDRDCRPVKDIPPVEVGGRQLIRRARTPGSWAAIPGSTSLCVRWPAWTADFFYREVSGNRSAFVAKALERELSILHHTGKSVALTVSTGTAFAMGADAGILYGCGLVPTETLDPAHVEDLVAREIAAYLLEPVLDRGRRRRMRSRRSTAR